VEPDFYAVVVVIKCLFLQGTIILTTKNHCDHLWLRFVTSKSGQNVAGFRKLQKAGFKRLFFEIFCDGMLLYYKNCYNVTVTNVNIFVYLLKVVTMKMVIESFKSYSLSGFFVTIFDLVYFYTSLAYSKDLLI
jgi:hypothetical protein